MYQHSDFRPEPELLVILPATRTLTVDLTNRRNYFVPTIQLCVQPLSFHLRMCLFIHLYIPTCIGACLCTNTSYTQAYIYRVYLKCLKKCQEFPTPKQGKRLYINICQQTVFEVQPNNVLTSNLYMFTCRHT